MRCFFAVEVSAPQRAALVQVLRALPPTREVRWVSAAQLHVTLQFLGELTPEQATEAQRIGGEVAAQVAPFELRLTQLGAFPHARAPRVLWVGVDDPAQGCARWVASAAPLLSALGAPREDRPFTPHITLGRSKSPAGARLLCDILNRPRAAPPATPGAIVRRLVLFQSTLHPGGAEYTPLARLPLGAPA